MRTIKLLGRYLGSIPIESQPGASCREWLRFGGFSGSLGGLTEKVPLVVMGHNLEENNQKNISPISRVTSKQNCLKKSLTYLHKVGYIVLKIG